MQTIRYSLPTTEKSVDLALIWFMSYKHITVIHGLSRLEFAPDPTLNLASQGPKFHVRQ
jgi:hypothetical protein